MSQFKTTIPVDSKAVIDALPRNSYLHEVRYNAAASVCEVLWENDDIKSGYNFAVDLPLNEFPTAYKQQQAGFAARMAQIEAETGVNPAPPAPEPQPEVEPVPVAGRQPKKTRRSLP